VPGIRAELTFVGTATTVIRLGEFTLLTDPNFLHKGQRSYLGRGLWSRRLTEPAMGPGDLPELDAILLSHLHGDHFDRIAKRDLSHATPVITTPHAARRLRRYEFETVGLQPWATHKMRRADEELTISATPAVHARGVMGRLLPPVMGSLLEHRVNGVLRQRLHISGDTLTGPHVDEIAHRFDDIDTAVCIPPLPFLSTTTTTGCSNPRSRTSWRLPVAFVRRFLSTSFGVATRSR